MQTVDSNSGRHTVIKHIAIKALLLINLNTDSFIKGLSYFILERLYNLEIRKLKIQFLAK